MFVCQRLGFACHRLRPTKSSFRFSCDMNLSNDSNGTNKTHHEPAELLGALNNLDEWEPKYQHFLSANQFLRLQQWKVDNGLLKTVDNLLAINGFDAESIKKLQPLCDPASIPEYIVPEENQMLPELLQSYTSQEIDFGNMPNENEIVDIENDQNEDTSAQSQPAPKCWYTDRIEKYGRKSKLTLEPKRSKIDPKRIHTYTAIHQSITGLNWTTFSRYDQIGWNGGVCINEGIIANATPVLIDDHLCQKIQKLTPIVHQIPVSDLYILETDAKTNVNSFRSLTSRATVEIIQLNQLNTILTTILLSRALTNDGGIENMNIYFLGSFMVAKLFGLKLGKETVSTQPIVRDILKLRQNEREKVKFIIDISHQWRELFHQSERVNKEGLGKSMLIGLTFFHLALNRY